ncbi:MAG: farnesyltranstransferase, partial [Acidiphilium sp. 37-67-22]
MDGLLTSGQDGGNPRMHSHDDSLHRLASVLRDDLDATNRTIVARMASDVQLIPQLAAHLVAAGGKRLR